LQKQKKNVYNYYYLKQHGNRCVKYLQHTHRKCLYIYRQYAHRNK